MQKLIAKYGTAAHLAILAVAPLFLFPFFGTVTTAGVMLWLSLPALVWTFLEPSMRRGEMLHDARARVARAVFRDGVFWSLVAVVAIAGLRALNDGVALVYEAETVRWTLSQAAAEFFPCCARGRGYLPFAMSVVAAVLIIGCRHALGGAARMAFALVLSTLAGAAGLVAVYLVNQGQAGALAACDCSAAATSFVGTGFLACFLFGLLASMAALERKWYRVMPLFLLSVGGTAVAGFVFSPVRNFVLFAVAAAVLLVYVVLYSVLRLSAATEFKVLVIVCLSLAIGCVLVMAAVPAGIVSARVTPALEGDFLPADLLSLRQVLSGVALRIWKGAPWLGTGLGAFALNFRFVATPEELAAVPVCRETLANGYWQLLAERGIVGAAVFALPALLLLVSYCRRAVQGVRTLELPHPSVLVGPLAVAATCVAALYDVSFLRGEVIAIVGASLALSANAFAKIRKDK